MAKIKLQFAKVEADKEIKLESVKLERIKLEHSERIRQGVSNTYSFDVSRHVKLVPPFNEHNVDTYFRSFEKLANALSWPRCYWSILLQTLLTGKAQCVFVALSEAQCADYDIVKQEILKAYELIPEAYRQKFRGWRKKPDQSFVEFSRVKRDAFEQWLRSQKVTSFSQLCELILLEEFQTSVSQGVSVFLKERNASTLEEAAILADNYTLLHRGPTEKHLVGMKGGGDDRYTDFQKPATLSGGFSNSYSKIRNVENETNKTFAPRTCTYCGKMGHQMRSCWKRSREISVTKPVFVASELQDRELVNDQDHDLKPVFLVSGAGMPTTDIPVSSHCELSNNYQSGKLDTYEPFLSSGTITSQGEEREIKNT